MGQSFEMQEDNSITVLKEAKDLYHKIRSIYDKTGYSSSYQVGHMWSSDSGNQRDLRGLIESDIGAVNTIRHIDNTILYSINPSTPVKEKMVDWYISYLKQNSVDISKMDIAVQESPVTNPDVCVVRGGRLLTPDFLRTVILSLEIQKYCKISESRYRIVELGAGCGHLARTLQFFISNSVYIDIDIPETLYFAYIFIKLNFPDAKTCYVTDPSQLENGIEQYDFVFIPTKFAESILPFQFDLFCNTASLGEMSNPNIRYWMDFVQNKLKVRYFFGLNRYLNTIPQLVNQEIQRLEENEGSVLFDSKWNILYWELYPLFARCPYEEPSRANQNLEIVAERLPDSSVSGSDNRLRSQQLIQELMDEEWLHNRERYLNARMRIPVMTIDLTMYGTLFKLWESIRLFPNRTNVAMMLMYLHILTRVGYPFEEWFYYRKLLKDIVAKDKTSQSKMASTDSTHENLWKDALALSVSYNPFNIWLLYHYVMSLLPYRIRMPLIGFIGKIYSGLSKII